MIKTFILNLDNLSVLDELTDEEAGKLFKAIYKYQIEEKVDLDSKLKCIFILFKNYINDQKRKYEEKSKTNDIDDLINLI